METSIMADQQKKYPNIDYEKLNPIEKMYIKKTETGNMKRAVDLNAMTRRSRIIAASIFAAVSGICILECQTEILHGETVGGEGNRLSYT